MGGGEGVDNEPDGVRHCWEAPITWLEIAVILDKSALGKYSEGVGSTDSHLTATKCQCAVPCNGKRMKLSVKL